MPLTNPKSEDQLAKESRLWIAVVAILLILGAGAGAYLLRSPADAKLAGAGPALPMGSRPLSAAMPELASPPPVEDRLPRAKADELTFGDLCDILGAETAKPEVAPVAKKFAEEFMANKRTRETFNDFKKARERGDNPGASTFMSVLRHMPEFKAMASQFAFQSGGSKALMALAENPTLKKFLIEQKSLLKGQASMGAHGMRTASMARGLRNGGTPGFAANQAGLAAHGTLASASGGAADKAVVGYSASGAVGGGVPSGGASGISGGGAGGSGEGGPGWGKNGKSGEDSEVRCKKLSDPDCKIKNAGPDKTYGGAAEDPLKAWLRENGIDVAAMWRAMDDGYGVWGSCFYTQQLAKCAAACENPASFAHREDGALIKQHCRYPSKYEGSPDFTDAERYPYFAACMEAYPGDLGKCLAECPKQEPCRVDPAVGRYFCSDPPRYAFNQGKCDAAASKSTPIEAFKPDPAKLTEYCTPLSKTPRPSDYTERKRICDVCQWNPSAGVQSDAPATAQRAPGCENAQAVASDGQCLEMKANKDWAGLAGCDITTKACQERWAREHEAELKKLGKDNNITMKDPTVQEMYRRECHGDWGCAERRFQADLANGSFGEKIAAENCAKDPSKCSRGDSGPKRQPGCESARYVAKDGSCWEQPGGSEEEAEKWRQTLRDQGVPEKEIERSAARLYQQEHDKILQRQKQEGDVPDPSDAEAMKGYCQKNPNTSECNEFRHPE